MAVVGHDEYGNDALKESLLICFFIADGKDAPVYAFLGSKDDWKVRIRIRIWLSV